MDNVNKIILWIILPFLFLLYFSYLIFDYYQSSNNGAPEIVNQHKNNTLHNSNINSVILGGSNAFFGLSAEMLTKESGDNWLNLSIINEGYSDKNYWKFINNTLSKEQRLSVKTVVYSSIVPFQTQINFQNRFDSSIQIDGSFGFDILPKMSLAAYLKKHVVNNENNENKFPIPNSFGDFDFDKFKCTLPDEKDNYPADIDNKELSIWLKNQLNELKQYFPKSTIYFIFPSQFYNKDYDKNKIKKLSKFTDKYIDKYNKDYESKFIFINQPEIPNKNLICDDFHHPNKAGRIWRTNNLINHIYK